MSSRDWTTATDEEVMAADIAIELELDQLPQEAALAMLQEMGERVDRLVLERAIGSMDDRERIELETVTATGDAVAVQVFLTEHVSNYGELARQELIRFKRIMLTESPLEQELTASAS